jgi:uncharacterized membrane protein
LGTRYQPSTLDALSNLLNHEYTSGANRNMLALTQDTSPLHGWIEAAALALELFAIAIIILGVLYASVRFLVAIVRQSNRHAAYSGYKAFLGRTLLLGLEILVAADIVRTVALEPTLENIAILGILVLVRTFLSWSLVVEIEGRWPWRSAQNGARAEDGVIHDVG